MARSASPKACSRARATAAATPGRQSGACRCWTASTSIEGAGHRALPTLRPRTGARLGNRLAAHLPLPDTDAERHAAYGWRRALPYDPISFCWRVTFVSFALAPLGITLAGLSACGLAALAWASFVHPLPRLTYNPSDSVAVGWYRIDPLDHRRRARCHVGCRVGSIVLTRLPPDATTLAFARSQHYQPASAFWRLQRGKTIAPQTVCVAGGARGSWHCA